MIEETELRVALMKATRRLRQQKSDSELTDSQMSVLAVLDRSGPLTPRALADFERVQPPSMTRTLAALAERGLVDRAADPGDGRRIIVRITESGSAAVIATRRQRDAWLARRLAELDPDERAVLAQAAQILRRIADS
ncbi:MarR family winged helix-turn-helix transcriptional regulator [Kineosporia babensis]|uniref:MarR family transcriptional regulator n=1 Tax=Kineosporia babensis TaxID=499548 RepID=A0A9X1SV93_9ACTN|nr:MarR family transcriptional regulator [Kineosporia babensis]